MPKKNPPKTSDRSGYKRTLDYPTTDQGLRPPQTQKSTQMTGGPATNSKGGK